jgi:hypothetical protein
MKQIAADSTGPCVLTSIIVGRGENYETPLIYVAMRINTSSPPSRPRHLPVKVKVTLDETTTVQR